MNDIVLYWNEVALEANREAHTATTGEQRGPVLSARALAITHLAMFDAFVGTEGIAGVSAYLPSLPSAPSGASVRAAVSHAAFDTLVSLYPTQSGKFDAAMTAAGDLGPGDVVAGRVYGKQIAAAMLADRTGDPDNSAAGYQPSGDRGRHRRDPVNPQEPFPFVAPFYGARARNFAVTRRHGLDLPPPLTSVEYRRALREVSMKGIAPELAGSAVPTHPSETPRTPDETVIGLFWGYDGASGLGTPPRLYNQIVRVVAAARGNTPARNAHLFALVNAAMADAGILAWEQKYKAGHDLWRPVVAIREHDPSMGPQATAGRNDLDDDCRPDWEPLGAPASNTIRKNFTPGFPAYPSGHATFGAAALQCVRRFYGVTADGPDQILAGLTFVSDELNGVTTDNRGVVRPRHVRSFPDGLWQMIIENGRSRVYLGVHWVFDAFATRAPHRPNGTPDLSRNVGGVKLGLAIANDLADHGLRRSSVLPGV